MTQIGLVGCSSVKLDHAAAARDLYRSALFRKSSAWAEANCDQWYVLSAKHGLVHPDTVLEPYEAKLGSPRTGPPIPWWNNKVRQQLGTELALIKKPNLVVLAGSAYRSFLHPLTWPFEVPMEGMRIGQQLHWLTVALKAAAGVL
jgi:hypothetical protein